MRTPVQAHVHHCLVNVKFDGYPRAAVFVNRRNIDVFLNETLKPVVYHYTVGASVPLYPGTPVTSTSAQGARKERRGIGPAPNLLPPRRSDATRRSDPLPTIPTIVIRYPLIRRSPKTTLSDSSETSWKISFTVQRSLRARNSLFHRFSFSSYPF